MAARTSSRTRSPCTAHRYGDGSGCEDIGLAGVDGGLDLVERAERAVALAAIPGYLTLAPSWRPVALRVACALIVIGGCVRLVGRVRHSMDGGAPSVLDTPPPSPRAPALDERFLRLRGALIASTRSRRYFDAILWPRLLGLAGESLPQPAERRGLRRLGPSLSAVERLIAEAEKRA